jgi:hypothetical protein
MSQKRLVNTHATERAARESADEKTNKGKVGTAPSKAKQGRPAARASGAAYLSGHGAQRRLPAPSCEASADKPDEDQDATGQAAVRRTAGALGLAPAILVLAAFLATAATVRPGLTTSMGASPTSMPRCTTER